MKKPIIVLTGPTASGKTALSFELAKKFKGEIICADSMTVYRGMDIGTDKPTVIKNAKIKNQNDNSKIINGIRHHLLDVFDPDEEFNVTIFQRLAKEKIKEIHKRGNVPFLVGGSSLYIDSVIYNYSMPKVKPDEKLRQKLEKKTCTQLFSEICKLDPDCEWTIDRNNKRRLIRALEVIIKTGKPYANQKSKKALPKNVLYLALKKDRKTLYKKINNRVDLMIKDGFLDEVKKLYLKYDHNTAMQAAGYRQIIQNLDGEISLADAIEKTKQIHRNFAKKQMTWLKGNPDIVWIKNLNDSQKAIKKHIDNIKN